MQYLLFHMLFEIPLFQLFRLQFVVFPIPPDTNLLDETTRLLFFSPRLHLFPFSSACHPPDHHSFSPERTRLPPFSDFMTQPKNLLTAGFDVSASVSFLLFLGRNVPTYSSSKLLSP